MIYKSYSFYKNGLRFECKKCGSCCTGFPGYVYLSERNIKNISDFLMLDKISFLKKYTKTVVNSGKRFLSLIEKANYDCIFWYGLCTIYKARPYQCMTFPFWKKHLISENEWNNLKKFCPGINNGKLYSKEKIENILNNPPDYNIKQL